MNNLLAMYESEGLTARRVAGTAGGEHAGPCPGCGGEDRFRVFPERSRWFCRGCAPRGGDAIEYLRRFRGLSYPDACRALGIEPAAKVAQGGRPAAVTPLTWKPKPPTTPPTLWQEKAAALVAWAERNLWGDAGADVRAYLEGRGLTSDTIRAARLGWNPGDEWRDREDWGLPAEQKDDGSPRKLYIPAGVVIPVFGPGGDVARIKVRRMSPTADPHYLPVAGGDAGRFLAAGHGPIAVVVESELDSLLVAQEAGGLVTAFSTGSVTYRPDSEALERLQSAPLVLVALDSDGPGAKESWGWWTTNITFARRWPVPEGKDPTDSYQAGHSLREWIMAGLDYYSAKPDQKRPKAPRNADPKPGHINTSQAPSAGHVDQLTPAKCREGQSWPVDTQRVFVAHLDAYEALGWPLAQAEGLAYQHVIQRTAA